MNQATTRDRHSAIPLLEHLERRGALGPKAILAAKAALARDEAHPERALIRAGVIPDVEVAAAYAELLDLPIFSPDPDDPAAGHTELGRFLPEKLCTEHLIAPVAQRDRALDVAFVSPARLDLVDELQFATGLVIRPLIAPLSIVEAQLEALYRTRIGNEATVEFDEARDGDSRDGEEGVLDLDEPPPPDENGRIIRMVNQILEQALRTGASDIHLEPFEDSCKFRLRLDGVLHEMPSPSRAAFISIISRFKILAKMDIAERRIPQDGAIALKSGDKRIDLRVSSVPTIYGEKIVMRLLDKSAIPLDLTRLGLDERQAKDLIEAIETPHGLALVTGPTGSGKSTTLYSCLNLLNKPKINICTVEDPVEYKFKGLNQVQVKPVVGLTFASALRSFLRQDPDVIMVGEVRDQETAEICLRAALTGHFVLSTLHTNDALSAVTRLKDMGIEPFLLSSTLRVLEAQRLVRRLCPHCKVAEAVTDEVARRFNIPAGSTVYKPGGCPRCRRMGYKGRVGVFEVIRITPTLVKLIQARASLPDLRQAARDEGMKLLFDSAMVKVLDGSTSLEAALSVTMADEE